MNRGLVIILAAIALGGVAYLFRFHAATEPLREVASVKNELAWLALEFRLTPEQMKPIEQLHFNYEPRCAAMCRKIANNHAELDRLIVEGRGVTSEMERLLRESAEIQVECRRELLAHIYAVAAVMPPGEGARYIRLLKTQVLQCGAPYKSAPPVAGAHE
jgi:hypothetical protein